MHKDIRPAADADALYVARHLKVDDLLELGALHKGDITPLVQLAVKVSAKVYAWGPEGEPMALFGVQNAHPVGYIWSLATPKALENWRLFHRETPTIINDLGQGYDVLANIKDARQHGHIRWLRSLGFTFINTHRMGPYGLPFHEFVRIQK
jgi:hypothetical protein